MSLKGFIKQPAAVWLPVVDKTYGYFNKLNVVISVKVFQLNLVITWEAQNGAGE